jgi:two-component system NarL family sensor kinase
MKSGGLAIVLFALCLQIRLCKAQPLNQRDTSLVIELNKKGWEASVNDLELSKKYATEAIRIANRLHYAKGLSYSFNIYGSYFKAKGKYDSAVFYYTKSLEIREKIGDPVNISRSYRNIITMQGAMGDEKSGIETGLKAIDVLKPYLDNPTVLAEKAWLEVTIGGFYREEGSIEQALYLILDSKHIFSALHDQAGLAAAIMEHGSIYKYQENYRKALEEYSSLIPIYTQLDNQQELAKAYNNLGNIYYLINDYKKALFNYRKSLDIRQHYGFADDANGSLLNLGIIYETFGKLDSAAMFYKQALDQSKAVGDAELEYETRWAFGTLLYSQKKYPEALSHLLMARRMIPGANISTDNNPLLKDISKVYGALGIADSALFYSNQYALLSDSLNESLRKSIEMGSTILEKEKDIEISKARAKSAEQEAKQKSMTIFGMWIGIFFLFIIFFLYYLFVRSKRNMQELREQVKDKELKVLDAMLEGQHEERKRLATELHDTIGSALAATKYLFKGMEKSLEKLLEENKGQYRKINTMLDETMESVRRISHNMASGIFTEKGMEGALADLSQTFEQAGKMRVHLSVYGFDQRPEYNTEVNLYRMVQELLTNIMKHAQAHEVTIQLIKSNENINLTVEDDGRGFDPIEARRKKGIGLSNIELRVKKLSGKWNIDSGKGRGTTVIIDIPVKNNEA